jgi:arylsulfatase A-like enzyme
MRPGGVTAIGILLLTVLGVPNRSGFAGGPRRPNLVLIVADDLGYAELGCQEASDVRTPHIDAIARHGVRFTSGYVTAPVCSPSRAGLMTGRYPQRLGHELNAIAAPRPSRCSGPTSRPTTIRTRSCGAP